MQIKYGRPDWRYFRIPFVDKTEARIGGGYMNEEKINRVPYYLIISASIVVIIAGLQAATSIIVPFLIAVFVAIISLPLQHWLIVKKIPRILAVLLTLLADLLILVGFGFLVGGSIQGFETEYPKYQAKIITMAKSIIDWLNGFGLNISINNAIELLKDHVFSIFTNVVKQGANFIANMVFVFLTILFVLVEAAGFKTKLTRAFGTSMRVTGRLHKIIRDVQQYLVVKTLVSAATGILVGVSLALIGLDFPILWGLLAFLLNYIPSLGSIIAAVPPILLALIQLGKGSALAVAIVFILVNIILGNLLEPHLMGRRLGLSVLVVFLSLAFWGWIWGYVGMILSVPLTMLIKIMLENTPDLRWIAIMLGSGKEERTQTGK